MSSYTFRDSYPQTPRTFGRLSDQYAKLSANQTISNTFEAFDDIEFDLAPFTVQDTIREDSEILEEPRFSWKTSSLYSYSYYSVTNESPASDDKSQLYICAPLSPVPAIRQPPQSILPDDITGTFVSDRQYLHQRVHSWLAALPDIPWFDVRCMSPIYDDTASLLAGDSEHRKETSTEVNNSLHNLDVFDFLYENNRAATLAAEEYNDMEREYHAMERELQAQKEGESNSSVDVARILDAYHKALLHIHLASTSAEVITWNFRPSMRRQYPRGLEEEARQSISLIASSNSH
ncbi:hypothetical protein FBEOM_2482 [Fusarium beomiforme]|uniref:Uncharacterized protein n=1 Tax=Fusarium beomiforme TaxID=44412 RepID=A0A9P5E3A0_9HYPO|nr:hypothetical protein FBEOM_2482 [Fusarium beomiforme]